MSAKIAVTRTDHTPEDLRALAAQHKYRDCRVRLRAIALIIEDELSRGEIACGVGVDVQTLRDWVVRYNARGLDGLRDARSGRPRKLDARQTAELVSKIEAGTDPDAGEPSRWTLATVRQWIKDRFDVDYTVEGVRQMLRRLGFRHLSPRPIHPKANPEAQEEFRNTFRSSGHPSRERVGRRCSRVQDEARIGQKGMLSRVWARKGTRPRIPRDYGTAMSICSRRPVPRPAMRWTCVRQGEYRGNEPSSAGYQQGASRRQTCGGGPGRGRLAPIEGSQNSVERLVAPAAAVQSGTEPDRDTLGRLHPQDRGDHANHQERLGTTMKNRPKSIGDFFLGLVLVRDSLPEGRARMPCTSRTRPALAIMHDSNAKCVVMPCWMLQPLCGGGLKLISTWH